MWSERLGNVHYAGKYSENAYPSEFKSVTENEVTVSVMHKSGGFSNGLIIKIK